MNAFINAKSNIKKLQFGSQKCFKIHVGNNSACCPDLYLDHWELKKVKDFETGESEFVDAEIGEFKVSEATDEKYLGDIISHDGKNSKNIETRIKKGLGIISQIKNILEETCLGKYHFQVAMILRNSLFINGILTNSEAWYGVKKSEIEELEKIDENILRNILETPVSTAKEMLYLELGCLPIGSIIKSRRLMFLHHILHQEKSSLIYKFLKAQKENPAKNDWSETVIDDLSTLDLKMNFEDIEKISKNKFKDLVDKSVKKEAFENLCAIKKGHSKVNKIEHKSLTMQNYLQPNNLTCTEAKYVFMFRTRMIEIKTNFKNKHIDLSCQLCRAEDVACLVHLSCPLCEVEEDSQPHLLHCSELNNNYTVMMKNTNYENLFSEDLDKQISIGRILIEKYQSRKLLEAKQK